jgi:hypothetical protein
MQIKEKGGILELIQWCRTYKMSLDFVLIRAIESRSSRQLGIATTVSAMKGCGTDNAKVCELKDWSRTKVMWWADSQGGWRSTNHIRPGTNCKGPNNDFKLISHNLNVIQSLLTNLLPLVHLYNSNLWRWCTDIPPPSNSLQTWTKFGPRAVVR